MPPLLIAPASAVLVVRSWLKWPDVLVDYGQQLYVAWRLSEGEVLYRDLAYFHGPLSSYVHAGVMRLWGVSLLSLVFFNLMVVAGLVVLMYKMLADAGSRFSATAACLVFVTVFAFAQYLAIGNYNYVCPYTSEITHGLVLALAAIYALQLHARTGKRTPLIVSGLALGLTFLTKTEVFTAAALALAAGLAALFWRERLPAGEATRRTASLALAALVPPALAFGLFCLAVSPSEALGSVTAAVTSLFGEGTSELLFYRSRMGLDAPVPNLGRLAVTSLWYLAALVPALAAAHLAPSPSAAVRGTLVLAWIPVLVLAWNVGSPLWLQTGRPLPVCMVVLAAAAVAALVRERRAGALPGPRPAVAVLTLAVFALALLTKILLNSRVYHYGFVLAMPATLLVVLAWLEWIPRWIDRRGGRGGVFRAVAVAVLAVAVAAHLLATERRFRAKDHLAASGADAFWSDARGRAVDALLEYLASVEAEEPTLLVVPDGIMLNYLARIPTPLPYLNYVPTEVFAYGEERILGELRKRPPDFVAVVDKSTAEFGFPYFGRDYARGLSGWIRESYETVGVIGNVPLTGKGFGIEVMRRRPSDKMGATP